MDSSASSAARRLAALQTQLAPEPCGVWNTDNPGQALQDERKAASFSSRKLTYFLDGGEDTTRLKEQMMLELERDPMFANDDRHDLTRNETRERTMAKVRSIINSILSDTEEVSRMRFDLLSLVDPGFMTRVGVHFGLFFGTVRGQATSEQMSSLIERGMLTLQNFYGCFAMTELGHGSNVAGIETTATLDKATDTFVIHTPTLTATKWWIGGAAQSATHSVVFAQLIVDGKKYGVKPFIVQLRDPSDFSMMPGVTIGDCGAKMGRNGIDNGWIQFTNVRIPRENMLMKHTKVAADGTVTEPPLQQLAYGALIGGRVQMVMDSANVAKLALTIPIRYGLVRRQFAPKEGGPETLLLDYASYQYRLLPLLALTYAMHFGGVQTNKLYSECMERIEVGNVEEGNTQAILDQLKALHATAAGLKAFCTWNCLDLIEQCRQSLGGHGYSSYAGLAALYQDFAVQCSWEGDNTIMMLQCGRYLVNCYRDAKNGKPQAESVGYLNNIASVKSRRSPIRTADDLTKLSNLVDAYDVVCAHLVSIAGEAYEEQLRRGVDADQAYQEVSVPILTCARAHCMSYLLRKFVDAIGQADREIVAPLTRLCVLYATFNIQNHLGVHLLQYGYLDAAQFSVIREAVPAYCKLVRRDAVPLTDAFNLSDFVIGSPMGRYDGDIYRHYFDKVKRAPYANGVPPYFETVTKKLFTRKLNDD